MSFNSAFANQNLAAWVQAIGSVIAILISVAVVFLQHSLSGRAVRKQALQADIANVKALLSVAEKFVKNIEDSIPEVNDGKFEEFGYWNRKFEQHDTVLSALTLECLVRHELIIEWHEIKEDAISCSRDFIVVEITNGRMAEVDDVVLHMRADNCKKNIVKIQAKIDELRGL